MDIIQNSPDPNPQNKNNRKIKALILPFISFGISSVIGIIIGQIGNLVYSSLGDLANCMVLPGFVGLFLITFTLSFFVNQFVNGLINQVVKRGEQ